MRWTAIVWPLELVVFLWPIGMVQVINGTVDDGYNGMLGWIWIACAVTTIGLVALTWFALKERYYSAVMAATGLLYLAILTAFGTDLIARAVLSRSRLTRPQATKYLASGWGTTIAEVDCSGTRWNSSVIATPMRSISSSSATFTWSSRSGHAG